MKVQRSDILKARRAVLLSGAMLIAMVPGSGAQAADVSPVLKAPPAPVVEPGWYFNGGFEAAGRFYIDRPPTGFGRNPGNTVETSDFLRPPQTESRAKFEQFGNIPEGAYLDWFNLNWGSKDGRYAFDLWGRNVFLGGGSNANA